MPGYEEVLSLVTAFMVNKNSNDLLENEKKIAEQTISHDENISQKYLISRT